MSAPKVKIKDLVADQFPNTNFIVIDKAAFLFNNVERLTAFVSPFLQRGAGQVVFSYNVGLVVVESDEQSVSGFENFIRRGEYVSLPRVVGVKHTLDQFVESGKVSDFIKNDISEYLVNYTLSSERAKDILDRDAKDYFLYNFRNAYADKFESWIRQKL